MKTKFKLNILCGCMMAMALTGCGGSDSSPPADKEETTAQIPDATVKPTVVVGDIAVYGKVDKSKVGEVDLDSGVKALVLDDNAQDSGYAAAGLKIPQLPDNSTKVQNHSIYTSVSEDRAAYNYADAATANKNDNGLSAQAQGYLLTIQEALKKDGATVNALINQEIINSQSAVIQVVLDVNFTNTKQSPSYVRNQVLTLLNNGKLPKNTSVSSTENDNKLRLNLSFWKNQDQLLLWVGSYLAKNKEVVEQMYGDLNNASALTSATAIKIKTEKADFKQLEGSSGSVDILWSIDASGSMYEEQQNLANGAEQFFNTLNAAGIDYRLAVNTQGYDSSRYTCKTLRKTTSGSSYIDSNTPNALVEWKALAQPGTNDSATETGFYCTKNVDMTGFDRPNAKNLVVFVSDEPENETVKGNIPSVEKYGYQSQDFNSYKQYFTKSGATYFAITGTGSVVKPTIKSNVDLNANGDYRCRGDGGRAEGGANFKEIAKLTGGSAASICADAKDWSVMFEQILKTATGLASNFKLKYSPIPSTVKVLVNGKAVPRDVTHKNGFDLVYGKNDVSLTFYGNKLPQKGSEIKISYDYNSNQAKIK